MVAYEQAKAALEGAIQKWVLIESGGGVDLGSNNCPMCLLYMRGGRCGNCPIFLYTGYSWCNKTPYDKWSIHHIDEGMIRYPMTVNCEECRTIAQDMVKFLESLRGFVDKLYEVD
jgi:hypothetical protein